MIENPILKYLIIFIVSMLPLFEFRYAAFTVVPALNPESLILAIIVGVIGNMLPVPIIYLFARKVLEWGKDKKVIGKFFTWCLNKGERGGKKLEAKAGKSIYWALFLFVGIPVPGTGAWTGTLAASMLKLDFKKTILATVAGVILASLIMLGLAYLGLFGFEWVF